MIRNKSFFFGVLLLNVENFQLPNWVLYIKFSYLDKFKRKADHNNRDLSLFPLTLSGPLEINLRMIRGHKIE